MRPPGRWTIRGLFAGRPGSLRRFRMVGRFVRSLGRVKVEASKTQVSFGTGTKFAWVWLPQMWIRKRPQDSITLAFDARRRIRDRRIADAAEPRPGRWTHHVLIDKESDFDGKVKGWLREAYRNSLPGRPKGAQRPRR